MKLEICHYSKVLDGRKILDDINLSFNSGKIYALYGKNGSGKTMLFRAITTLIIPTSGDVKINNQSILDNEYDLSHMGILIENPGFFDSLTGFENLELLYCINNKKDSFKIESIMERVGLGEAKKVRFSKYSLGMKQRLGIAQALMEDQSIIILDEPTNGIDEAGVHEIRNLILEEKNKNKIIIIASHNKEDLEILADYIIKIDNGKIMESI